MAGLQAWVPGRGQADFRGRGWGDLAHSGKPGFQEWCFEGEPLSETWDEASPHETLRTRLPFVILSAAGEIKEPWPFTSWGFPLKCLSWRPSTLVCSRKLLHNIEVEENLAPLRLETFSTLTTSSLTLKLEEKLALASLFGTFLPL